VAGRHIKALSLLDVRLGDTQALTMPETLLPTCPVGRCRGDHCRAARIFSSEIRLADYCDLVLMPALHLARIDLEAGAISADQQSKVRSAMVAVIAAIGGREPQTDPPP